MSQASGRWPANVVLIHAEGCERVGTKRVRGSSGTRGSDEGNAMYGDGRGLAWPITGQEVGYVDEDGVEEVEAWECVEGCPVAALDAQSGSREGGHFPKRRSGMGYHGGDGTSGGTDARDVSGGASRFFYCAKASRSEREAGLLGKVTCVRCGGLDSVEHTSCRSCSWVGDAELQGSLCPECGHETRVKRCVRNDHPTVKPVDLMRWLLRLVTPPGGVVLDPFTGSGSTGVAAKIEGFVFVGVEENERSHVIAETRIAHARFEPPAPAHEQLALG